MILGLFTGAEGAMMNWTLTMMLSFFVFGPGGAEPATQDEVNKSLQRVYDAIVGKDGQVDYATLNARKDLQADLNAYSDYLSRLDLNTLDGDAETIAVLSNAYNVFTLIGVNRAWPVESVRDIRPLFGFFTKDEWVIGGKKHSLNDIEKGMLRDLDPRIHFTINCASASCPVIWPQVFTKENIEASMNQTAIDFINDETKNRFDTDTGTWYLSKIFDWYRADWGKEKDVIAFIRKYRPTLDAPKKVKYLEYDWALNGPIK